MEKVAFNKCHRPKSTRIRQYALTESNNNYNFPNIRDKIEKKYFLKTRLQPRNLPEYSYRTFFKSSTPFKYYINKKNKNEFTICFDGGPRKKFSLGKKKLNLNLVNIYNFPKLNQFRLKNDKCLTTNNEKEKMKYKNIYNQLEEDKNNKGNNRYLNRFTNPNKNTFTIRSNDIDEKEEEKCKENGGEKEEEKIDKDNYFRKRKKTNFLKIQIHNNCKPFLVDDYRYYAEKYL